MTAFSTVLVDTIFSAFGWFTIGKKIEIFSNFLLFVVVVVDKKLERNLHD